MTQYAQLLCREENGMFEFDELTFLKAGQEAPEISPATRAETQALQGLYPEMAHWTHAAFLAAWENFSEEIYAISRVNWLAGQREPAFLAFCYVRQRWPQFDFGGTGLYDSAVMTLGEEQPWAQSPPPAAPEWAAAGILKKDLPDVVFPATQGGNTP